MGTILVVDDNIENRDVFVQFLAFKGHTPIAAENGAEALTIARREQPDLIMMDLSMPQMSGWEAIQRLKEAPDTAHIPVLVMTAHAMERERAQAVEAGCDDYMVKPVDLLALLARTEELLQRCRLERRSGS